MSHRGPSERRDKFLLVIIICFLLAIGLLLAGIFLTGLA
jgi:hypothetical protein